MNLGDKEFHVAPMLDVSTVEFRYFVRLLTKRAVIWNQMVVAETLVHRSRIGRSERCGKETSSCEPSESIGGDGEEEVELTEDLKKHCGWWDGCEDGGGVDPHPTVCQIGSNDPGEAAFAVRVVRGCGYDAVDLNCECPSDRVKGRCFGAALMKDQDAAVEIVSSMVRAARRAGDDDELPVSVKTRIGVDEEDSFEFIASFVRRLVDAGCGRFVIHARKVYTQGLSPAQNRDVPPVNYPRVFRLMEAFPRCSFVMNGGMTSLEHAREVAFGSAAEFDEFDGRRRVEDGGRATDDAGGHSVPCRKCDLPRGSCLGPPRVAPPNLRGVMVARLARDRPADLADVDRYFYGEASNPCRNRRELMGRYIAFLERAYPRRCCDDDGAITLEMARGARSPVVHLRRCCDICREFRGQVGGGAAPREDGGIDPDEIAPPERPPGVRPSGATDDGDGPGRKQSGKRAKRHAKYGGAKIVTRIVDRALQPTWGILAGEAGNRDFRRTSHDLSRDGTARNCGPGFVLWKAMKSVSDEVWDKPFESSGGGKAATYYPSK